MRTWWSLSSWCPRPVHTRARGQLQLDRQAMKHTLDSQRHQLDEVRNMMDHIQADGMNGLLKVKDAVMQFDDLVHRVRLEREGGSEIRPRRF